MDTPNFSEMRLPPEMAKFAEQASYKKTTTKLATTFLLALTAGVFISSAFVFYLTVTAGLGSMPVGIAKMIGGLCFTQGLILVVVCGGDLFTSAVLSLIARASGRITWGQLVANWSMVYLGNFVGAMLFVSLIWLAGQQMAMHGDWGFNVLKTASYKLQHSFVQALCLGILANLMVCLAVWMSYAGRTLTDKVVVMLLPISMFVAGGFEHSIANMFLIPMAIVIHSFASPEFWTMAGVMPEQFASLTVNNFVFLNLIPVTIGNIIGGGVLVGLTFWRLHLRGAASAVGSDSTAANRH